MSKGIRRGRREAAVRGVFRARASGGASTRKHKRATAFGWSKQKCCRREQKSVVAAQAAGSRPEQQRFLAGASLILALREQQGSASPVVRLLRLLEAEVATPAAPYRSRQQSSTTCPFRAHWGTIPGDVADAWGGVKGCVRPTAVAASCRWRSEAFDVAVADTGGVGSRLISRRVAYRVSRALRRIGGSVL
jgi:hypothetical protein